MKFTLNNSKISLGQFYDEVARLAGFDPSDDDIRYDCRKICIAENIQDNFFEYYRELSGMKKEDVNVSIAMMLVCSGPKVDFTLAENEVVIFPGFISFNNVYPFPKSRTDELIRGFCDEYVNWKTVKEECQKEDVSSVSADVITEVLLYEQRRFEMLGCEISPAFSEYIIKTLQKYIEEE